MKLKTTSQRNEELEEKEVNNLHEKHGVKK